MIFTLFFLFLSCQCQPLWIFEKTVTCRSDFNSGVLFYPAEDPITNLELEITQTGSGLYAYINVFACPILSTTQDHQVEVSVTINSEENCFLADILTGGQRLLLPDDARDLIIGALLDGMAVDVRAGPYRQNVSPDGFRGGFCQLTRLFS